jgi:epoxide hydrolase-like predicted phosphatase
MKSKKKSNIKLILFDIGGVLALGNSSRWKDGKVIPSGVHLEVSEKLNIPLDSYLEAIETNFALAIEGKISKDKVLEVFSKKLNTTAKNFRKIFVRAYKNNFKQNKELQKKAFELRKLGYKIGVLSDQWYLSREALTPLKIYKNFNKLIISYEVGVRKPNPEIYKIALKKFNINPEETLFIDNQLWNLKPAKKMGINTILFKNNEQLFQDEKWRNLFKK